MVRLLIKIKLGDKPVNSVGQFGLTINESGILWKYKMEK